MYHRKMTHGQSFQCDHCDYNTKTKGHLEKHIGKTHEYGQVGFKCSYCIFFTQSRKTLNIHITSSHTKATRRKLSAINKKAVLHKKDTCLFVRVAS